MVDYKEELEKLYNMAVKQEKVSMALHILQLRKDAEEPIVAREELKETVK